MLAYFGEYFVLLSSWLKNNFPLKHPQARVLPRARRVQVSRLVPVARLDSAWAGVSYGMYQLLHDANNVTDSGCHCVSADSGLLAVLLQFRTVVRPGIWDKSSDIKIGQRGRPWLVWYLCRVNAAVFPGSLNSNIEIVIASSTSSLWNSLTQSRLAVSRWTALRYFHCLRRTITRITDKIIVERVTTIPCIDPADLSINISN